MESVNANLLDLPEEVLLYTFNYLDFDNIAKLRPVCSRVNNICVHMLNKEFQKTMVAHRKILASLRPPSGLFYTVRYNVNLLKQLQKTLGFYIKQGYCAFYPGRILDISRSNLRTVKYHFVNNSELRRLVPMASKHFTKCIQPRFKQLQLNLRNSKEL